MSQLCLVLIAEQKKWSGMKGQTRYFSEKLFGGNWGILACAGWNSCLVVWELQLGGGGSAHKSIEASPGLLFLRAQMACTLQAVMVCRNGNWRRWEEFLCLLPGRFREEKTWAEQRLWALLPGRGLVLCPSCAHTSGSGMCCGFMAWFHRIRCQSHGFLLYVLKANNPWLQRLFPVCQHAGSWGNT